ncbi:CHASE2 domain-containing protein [Gemmobacter serpentinus]|uniref:CHASE2 domain-containing protein n=1 Tax=Gemmobacter serpentinus TaxID=2652247 RepID=UPI00124DB4B4|nr:adenylate/guanylate cyclase domain-containing protein [Gemmobacter serpentinus]
MTGPKHWQLWPLLLLAFAAASGLLILPDSARARYFDRLMMAWPSTGGAQVLVIDIGAQDETGAPWDRAASARLIAQVASAQPRALGIDMLFAGDCDGPAALAVTQAMRDAPTVTGFLLLDQPAPPPAAAQPLAVADDARLWPATGMEAPCPGIAEAARGLGSMALAGDSDGVLRHAAAGVRIEDGAYPTLPVALAQLALKDASAPLLTGQALRVGQLAPLSLEDGLLRLAPASEHEQAARQIEATEILQGEGLDRLAGQVILIGSSLPERGGLRATAAGPLTPSVQIAADLTGAILSGQMPRRPATALWIEAGLLLAFGTCVIWLALRRRPMQAAIAAATMVLTGWGTALVLWKSRLWLIDPLWPGLALLALLGAALLIRARMAARAEQALRARLGQLLPAPLVSRIAAEPDLLRLKGELREVTALFTDIEGFSLATRHMGPEQLVATLDAYFSLTCRIVLDHGGMIDKLVGDAIHALFNAPLDQLGHESAALACAHALQRETRAFAATHGLGITRIGLECGAAVLGDVGAGGKIDYTAHGDAVNLAARLQEANKALGTMICIGPELARRLPDAGLRDLGLVEIRSFGPLRLWTPD